MLVVSTSHDEGSRSEKLAARCLQVLEQAGAKVELVSLKDHGLPMFKGNADADSNAYLTLHSKVVAADGLVLASPVYNWSLSGALKHFIEHVGSTPDDGSLKGALFDKVVSFVCAAGLPHSYMALGPTALSLMLDFKCIINPYQVYMNSRDWEDGSLSNQADERLRRSMDVMLELTTLLKERTYKSDWCV